MSEQVRKVIRLLENVKRMPLHYLPTAETRYLDVFIEALYLGCEIYGLRPDMDRLKRIALKRGWDYDSGAGAYPYMIQQGKSEEEIITELLTLHILMWRSVYTSESVESDEL